MSAQLTWTLATSDGIIVEFFMDYLQLILPSMLAFAVEHLPWLLGAGAGLVLLLPALRRRRANSIHAALIARHAAETAQLREQLAAADAKLRLLEQALAAVPTRPTAVPLRDPRLRDATAEWRVPTPV